MDDKQKALEHFFQPRSAVLVGASSKRGKWGNHVGRNLLKGNGQVDIFFVNPNGGELGGLPIHRSLHDLPSVPQLAVIALPAAATEAAVRDCLGMGIRNFVVMSGGFSETGPEGAGIERGIVTLVKGADGLLLGPNCIGFQDSASGAYPTRVLYPEGRIGIVSQSGLVTHEMSQYARCLGLGYSRAINLGNQAVIELADAVACFEGHAQTDVLAIYCEGLRNGRRVLQAAERVRKSGIHVVLLTVGASEAAARSALSHTGAMVSGLDAVDAGCEAAGIFRAETAKETIALAACLASQGARVSEKRLGIVTDGGGLGSLSAEAASRAGLVVPELSPGLRNRLKSVSGPRIVSANPVDTAGEADMDMAMYARLVNVLLESDEVDGVLLTGHFGANARTDSDLGRAEVDAAVTMADTRDRTGQPFIVHSIYPDFASGHTLRRLGVPTFRDLEDAVAGLHAMLSPPAARGVPALGPTSVERGALDDSYWTARGILKSAGIEFPEARMVAGEAEALAFANNHGYPVVAKAVGLLHKSDLGGVRLGLADAASLSRAVRDLTEAFPDSPITVESQLDTSEGVEILVGGRVDPQMGPLVTVALGGIFAEILADTSTALAPVTRDHARSMVHRLKGAALLSGPRGRKPVDIDALADIIVAVSIKVSELRERIDSIEINPVLVRSDGAFALDARCILSAP
jgi:acyl-CoA synthetase (NDP forming)